MHLEKYELIAGESLTKFEFWSVGKRGKILKVIMFEPLSLPDTYNLAFGDANTATGELDDLTVKDNGDMSKVLATVIAALYAFTDELSGTWIYASGSTPSRTRLYQIGINNYFAIAQSDFYILDKYQNEWEWYEKGKNYQAFAVRRKMNKFE